MLKNLRNYFQEKTMLAKGAMNVGFQAGQNAFHKKGNVAVNPKAMIGLAIAVTFLAALTPQILSQFTTIKNDGNLTGSEQALAALLGLAFVGGVVYAMVKYFGVA